MARNQLTLRPDRIRAIDKRGFAFVPNQFLQAGFFTALTSAERSLYFLFVLVADRDGVSYHSHDNLSNLLGVGIDDYLQTRVALEDKDLIATAPFGARVQVLSLPNTPPVTTPSQPTHRTHSSPESPKVYQSQETPNYELGLSCAREILRNLGR